MIVCWFSLILYVWWFYFFENPKAIQCTIKTRLITAFLVCCAFLWMLQMYVTCSLTFLLMLVWVLYWCLPLPLYINFLVPIWFGMLLFGHLMIFLLDPQIYPLLPVQCVHDSWFVLVVSTLLMHHHLFLLLLLLLLLLVVCKCSPLLCKDAPLLLGLIVVGVCIYHMLLVLEKIEAICCW